MILGVESDSASATVLLQILSKDHDNRLHGLRDMPHFRPDFVQV